MVKNFHLVVGKGAIFLLWALLFAPYIVAYYGTIRAQFPSTIFRQIVVVRTFLLVMVPFSLIRTGHRLKQMQI
jgi:hypothetical protein